MSASANLPDILVTLKSIPADTALAALGIAVAAFAAVFLSESPVLLWELWRSRKRKNGR